MHFESEVFIHTPHTYAVACIVLGRAAFCMTLDRLRNYVSSSNRGLLGRGLLRSVTMNWITRLALTLQGRPLPTRRVTWFGFRLGLYEFKHLILPGVFLFIALENSSKPAFFFTAEGVIVKAVAAARLPASWLMHPPFDGADVIHIQLQSWHGNQDACRLFTSKWREKNTLFFFLERKKFFPRNFAKPKARRC